MQSAAPTSFRALSKLAGRSLAGKASGQRRRETVIEDVRGQPLDRVADRGKPQRRLAEIAATGSAKRWAGSSTVNSRDPARGLSKLDTQ